MLKKILFSILFILFTSLGFSAEWYVSSLAGGGGDGSSGSPWTLAEFVTNVNNSTIGNGDRTNIKADGTYSTTTMDLNVAGSATLGYKTLQGYTTTIGDGGIATIQRSSGTAVLLDTAGASYWTFKDLIFDGNSTAGDCIDTAGYNIFINVEAKNGYRGFDGSTEDMCINCYAHDNSDAGFNVVPNVYSSISANNGTWGFSLQFGIALNSISVGNGLGQFFLRNASIYNCIADGTGGTGSGIDFDDNQNFAINCNIVNIPAGKEALDVEQTGTGGNMALNCNLYNNDSDTNDATIQVGNTAINPQFNDTTSFDYTRNTSALDGQGYSTIGLVSAVDYDIDIGIGRLVPTVGAPTFAGITQLEAVGGRLRATWAAGTGTITSYNVYIRNGSSTDLFTSTYLLCKLPNTLTDIIFTTEADGSTLLQSTSTYHVGIRADNDGTEDANTASFSVSADGDGSTVLTINDRKIAIVQ